MNATLALVLIVIVATSSVPAFAKKDSSASGTFEDTKVLYTNPALGGTILVIDQVNAGTITGTFSGTYITYVHLTLDLTTNDAVYQALDVCTCTVNGKSGTLSFYEQGTITQIFLSSSAAIVDGTNHLAKLHGSIALQGIVYDTTRGLTEGTYAGQVWSGKSAGP